MIWGLDSQQKKRIFTKKKRIVVVIVGWAPPPSKGFWASRDKGIGREEALRPFVCKAPIC